MMRRVATRIGPGVDLDPLAIEMARFFWYVDASKARAQLGWRPREPQATLADTIADLRGGRRPDSGRFESSAVFH